MRKNRLEANTTVEIRNELNHLDGNEDFIKNTLFKNITKTEDVLNDLSIFTNKCL